MDLELFKWPSSTTMINRMGETNKVTLHIIKWVHKSSENKMIIYDPTTQDKTY